MRNISPHFFFMQIIRSFPRWPCLSMRVNLCGLRHMPPALHQLQATQQPSVWLQMGRLTLHTSFNFPSRVLNFKFQVEKTYIYICIHITWVYHTIICVLICNYIYMLCTLQISTKGLAAIHDPTFSYVPLRIAVMMPRHSSRE